MPGDVEMQWVVLLFRSAPAYDLAAIKKRAQEILGNEVDSSAPEEAGKGFFIYHKTHAVTYSDGKTAAPSTALISGDETAPAVETYLSDIQQSWRCPQAQELLRSCTHARQVIEMFARIVPPQDRMALFHGVLQAIIEASQPDALVFRHSQQVITPAGYLDCCDQAPVLRPGSLNVRFFKIPKDNSMIMDTRGLTEIGLHDLQCHFRLLKPNAVAGVLLDTAVYLFEKGPVIESGETLEGVEPGSKWRCQFENSQLEPRRKILDLNPGEPYAAGNRDGIGPREGPRE